MTAHAMSSHLEACLAAGMDAAVTKPVRPAELLAKIHQFVDVKAPPGTPAPQPAEAPPATEKAEMTVDKAALSQRVGGDPACRRAVIEAFLTSTPNVLADIRQAASMRDWDSLRRLAHMVKGSLAIFSSQAAQVALDLQKAAESGDYDGARKLVSRLETMIADLEVGLGAILEEQTPCER
jgi:HPt (histidine-containing phosphotransfer) domain-containing protein